MQWFQTADASGDLELLDSFSRVGTIVGGYIQASEIPMLAAKNPPGPRFPWIAFMAVYQDPLRSLIRAIGRYADVVRLEVGGRHHFQLNHPDYIRTILLDHNGMRRSVHPPLKHFLGNGSFSSEYGVHQRQRRLIQTAFHKERIAAFGEVMVRASARCSERWQNGATVNMSEEMIHLTMGIVGRLCSTLALSPGRRNWVKLRTQ